MASIAEIKNDVDELEPQVERLKALYQQYFMGIEKLPPLVLKKKVDRTIWKLRKIRFPNTALRFKFQQIIQRYNTYQQYWSRVMRDIERGTFKGHVVRAAKRFGADAVADGGRRAKQALAGMEREIAEEKKAEETVWELLPQGIDDLDFDDDAPTPPSNRFDVPPELAAATLGAPPVRGVDAAQLAARIAARGAPDRAPARHLDDELPAELRHATLGVAPGAPALAPEPAPTAKRGALFGGKTPSGELLRARPAVATRPGIAPPHVVAEAQPPPPPARPAPTAPTAARPAPPPPPPAGLGKPPQPKIGKPPQPKKDAAPKPADNSKTKAIYEEYVRARRAAGESTRGLTYDKVEKSLRSQTERLRKKHAGKKVEYEVVSRDGKTMIRPVIK